MGFKFFRRCYLRCEMKQNEKQCCYSKRAKPFAGKGRIYIAPISDITKCFTKERRGALIKLTLFSMKASKTYFCIF